jgi:DNA-formamidopyrimidine glycosylase
MPEGPEVKIASRYFNEFFKPNSQIKFEIITEYYNIKYLDVFNTVNNNLKNSNQTFTIGKNIFLKLKNNQLFNFHLGMTGGWSNKLIKHCHFRVFSKNQELFFKDVRKFGRMRIITQTQFKEKFNAKHDLLNKSYDLENHLKYLVEKINPNKSICSIMMDQKYFPGVGNYIKSESLYESKLHPEEKWGKINSKKRCDLIINTQKVMQNSYKLGGAELKDFKNPFLTSKYKLKIYGKNNTKEGNVVTSKITSDSRKSWFCNKKQRLI